MPVLGDRLIPDDAQRSIMVRAALSGASHKVASRLAGIPTQIFYQMLARWERGDQEYVSVFNPYREARTRFEMKTLRMASGGIRRAYLEDPLGASKAAMEFLARTRPGDYAKRYYVFDAEVPPEAAEKMVRLVVRVIEDCVLDEELRNRIAYRLHEVLFGYGPDGAQEIVAAQPLLGDGEFDKVPKATGGVVDPKYPRGKNGSTNGEAS